MNPVIRKIHKDGSITIPKAMLERLGWKAGTVLEVSTYWRNETDVCITLRKAS